MTYDVMHVPIVPWECPSGTYRLTGAELMSNCCHCGPAGGVQNLNAVAEFIRSEIDDHFNLHNPDEESQASWVSRTAAGLLMIGA
jgi:hypothetical protein